MKNNFLYLGQKCEEIAYNYDKLRPGLYRAGSKKPEIWNIKTKKWEAINEKSI